MGKGLVQDRARPLGRPVQGGAPGPVSLACVYPSHGLTVIEEGSTANEEGSGPWRVGRNGERERGQSSIWRGRHGATQPFKASGPLVMGRAFKLESALIPR